MDGPRPLHDLRDRTRGRLYARPRCVFPPRPIASLRLGNRLAVSEFEEQTKPAAQEPFYTCPMTLPVQEDP